MELQRLPAIDLLGLASLYAWTQDGELRALAKRGMDYVFYLLAVHSRKGFFVRSSGRTYLKEQFGNWSNCTSFMSWIGYGCGTPGHAGKGRGFPLPVGLRAAAGLCGLFQCRAGF